MQTNLKTEIEENIELAQMMAEDIDKIYRKYAKAAQRAEQERLEKVRTEKYRNCSDMDEFTNNIWAYGEITEEEYEAAKAFFAGQETRKNRLSLIEKHRANLKQIRDRWKGTANELQEELDELSGKASEKPPTYVEEIERQERAERYASLW